MRNRNTSKTRHYRLSEQEYYHIPNIEKRAKKTVEQQILVVDFGCTVEKYMKVKQIYGIIEFRPAGLSSHSKVDPLI